MRLGILLDLLHVECPTTTVLFLKPGRVQCYKRKLKYFSKKPIASSTSLFALLHGFSLTVPVNTCFSVISYVCRHAHYTNSTSSSFNFHHSMAKCLVRLEGYVLNKVMTMHQAQVENALQQWNINGNTSIVILTFLL